MRVEVVSTESSSLLLEESSAKRLGLYVLFQIAQHAGEEAFCEERALVVRSERAGQCGERRPQEHRRLRALSELRQREGQFRGAG